MALKIFDTLAPQGEFPAAKAKDIALEDGTRLEDAVEQLRAGSTGTEGSGFASLTQAQYQALVNADAVVEEQDYLIVRAEAYMPRGLSQEQLGVLEAAGLLPEDST